MDNDQIETKETGNEAVSGAPEFQVGERQDEVLDSVLLKCKNLNAAMVLSMNMGGYNIKEASYLIGYGEHPEQVSRMLSPDGPFPARLLDLWMDKVGNEIPLRWQALKRGYGLIRLHSAVERENEALRKESEEKDKEIAALKRLLRG